MHSLVRGFDWLVVPSVVGLDCDSILPRVVVAAMVLAVLRELQLYVLYVGIALFMAAVLPIGPVRRLSTFVIGLLQFRVPSPFSGSRASMPFLLFVGWAAMGVAAIDYARWYKRHGRSRATPDAAHLDVKQGLLLAKWADERDTYLWAIVGVVYLALHVIVACRERANILRAPSAASRK